MPFPPLLRVLAAGKPKKLAAFFSLFQALIYDFTPPLSKEVSKWWDNSLKGSPTCFKSFVWQIDRNVIIFS